MGNQLASITALLIPTSATANGSYQIDDLLKTQPARPEPLLRDQDFTWSIDLSDRADVI